MLWEKTKKKNKNQSNSTMSHFEILTIGENAGALLMWKVVSCLLPNNPSINLLTRPPPSRSEPRSGSRGGSMGGSRRRLRGNQGVTPFDTVMTITFLRRPKHLTPPKTPLCLQPTLANHRSQHFFFFFFQKSAWETSAWIMCPMNKTH